MKLCFSFYNIGNMITNFASQKVKSLSVTVKGPTLNFKYFPKCFCCKSVTCNYMTTHFTSTIGSESPTLSIFVNTAVTR